MKKRIIPFLKYWHWAYGFSLSLFIIFFAVTMMRGGFHLGVDFVGGMKIIVKLEKKVHEAELRKVLRQYNPTVQMIGESQDNNFIISTKIQEDSPYYLKERMVEYLEQKYPKAAIVREDAVFIMFKAPVDEGALAQKLLPMNAGAVKTAAEKNTFLIFAKEAAGKKGNFNIDAVEGMLKTAYPGLELMNGISIVIQMPQPVGDSQVAALGKKFNVEFARTGNAAGSEVIFYKISYDIAEKIKSDLMKNFKNVNVMSVEHVGPAVGSYLRQSALKLVLMAIGMMTIYLAYRFELRFAVGAMVALLHDITLAVAFCGVAGIEFNIPIIAALLTIFGYSVHDTIIIFDRIREDTRLDSKMIFIDIMDKAITETLSRTIITVLLTLFSVIALWLLGGEGISDFALVLLFGFVIGSYSSIYQAAPVVLWWEKLVKKVKA